MLIAKSPKNKTKQSYTVAASFIPSFLIQTFTEISALLCGLDSCNSYHVFSHLAITEDQEEEDDEDDQDYTSYVYLPPLHWMDKTNK